MRNLLTTLMLSLGSPMLLMGDEVRRSQGGNNNTWCQNNPLGWMHWQPDDEDLDLRRFLQRLIRLRRQLAEVLMPEGGNAELQRHWHGVELHRPDWASWSHSLAWSIEHERHGSLVWCGMNAFHRAMHFDLPPCPAGWMRVIDTGLPADEDLPERPERWLPRGAPLESRSLMLMVAAPLLQTEENVL
jgi:glycogen operon protein